jgi:hypothetical protein
MKSVNFKSAIIAGLVAGVVINISAISMVPAVGDQMDQVLAARGIPPLSNLSMVYFSFVSICLGLFLVFVYSVMRTWIKSKLKTVLVSAFTVWFISCFLSNVALYFYGFMPAKLVVIGIVWGLGELLVGGFVASRMYKDALS